jgi:tRNA threonylcarbamoyladenosine biosynthesis protein TsaB
LRPRLILAFDTTAAHCAAALLSGDDLLAVRVDLMAKGQAEHLMGMLAEVLAEHGRTWSDLTSIGVGTGPGNFTGIRISVAAARGLALGLGIPAIGVNGFDAAGYGLPRPVKVAIRAPRDMAYVQTVSDGAADPAILVPLTEVGQAVWPGSAEATLSAIARIAAKLSASPHPRPAPLYIRPPDAAPSRDAAPLLL